MAAEALSSNLNNPPPKSYGKTPPPPAYALLADLRSTTSHLDSTPSYRPTQITSNSYNYGGGAGSPRFQPRSVSRSPQSTRRIITEKYEYTTKPKPIYQNQDVYTYRKPHDQSGNLTELDSLLDELNSARYGSYPSKKGTQVSVVHNRSISPSMQRQSLQEHTNSVENLLEELQNAVPNQPIKQSPTISRRTVITTVSKKPVGSPKRLVQHPSSTTKELDDLMASLNEFKLNSPPSTPPTASEVSTYTRSQDPNTTPDENQLQSVLDDLQTNMSQTGDKLCASCIKPITGKAVNALGKTWHPEHFTCAHCKQELANKTFFERDGRTYCEPDYHKNFAPKCAQCNGPILDRCVTALDKTWHPEHFLCAKCGGRFGEDGFHEKDGKAYCRRDYLDLFAPKCGGCKGPITENYISALDKSWHPDCFKSRESDEPVEKVTFSDYNTQPYLETNDYTTKSSVCYSCQKPITGRCVTAMFRKFHPEHFVCSFCLKQLNKGTFKEENDKPYCHVCFEKLFR